MPTEKTSLKNITPAGDSNTTNEIVIGKSNTYQRTFLIVAGSLLALLLLIVVTGTSGGQQLQSSGHEIAEGVVALADYQAGFANVALTKDIFGSGAVSETETGLSPACSANPGCVGLSGCCCPTASGEKLACCDQTAPCKPCGPGSHRGGCHCSPLGVIDPNGSYCCPSKGCKGCRT